MRTSLLTVLLAGCASAPPTKADAFWGWFSSRSDLLQKVEIGSEPVLLELNAEVAKAAPGVAWILGGYGEEPRHFTLTAKGKRDLFPLVRSLVDAAPRLPGWTVHAFKPRAPETRFKVVYGNEVLDTDEVWFRAEKTGGKSVDLVMFASRLTPRNREFVERDLRECVQSCLGEVDAATKVGQFRVEPLAGDPKTLGLTPFADLVRVVDGLTR
jgi:hypothetical protein